MTREFDFAYSPFRAAAAFIGDLIGPALHGNRADATTSSVSVTWIVLLCLNASIALFLVALGHGAGRQGEAIAPVYYWSGVVLLVLPIVSRITLPVLARGVRA
jgi:hypothetical protein